MMSTDGQKHIILNEIPPTINGLIKHHEQSTPHHTHCKLTQYSLTHKTANCVTATAQQLHIRDLQWSIDNIMTYYI
jgi:hypothetical protein